MKKSNILKRGTGVLLFLAIVFIIACKKNYTCICTTHDSSGILPDTYHSSTINDTKSRASDACTNENTSSGTFKTTCSI